jgi:hypothetical protein
MGRSCTRRPPGRSPLPRGGRDVAITHAPPAGQIATSAGWAGQDVMRSGRSAHHEGAEDHGVVAGSRTARAGGSTRTGAHRQAGPFTDHTTTRCCARGEERSTVAMSRSSTHTVSMPAVRPRRDTHSTPVPRKRRDTDAGPLPACAAAPPESRDERSPDHLPVHTSAGELLLVRPHTDRRVRSRRAAPPGQVARAVQRDVERRAGGGHGQFGGGQRVSRACRRTPKSVPARRPARRRTAVGHSGPLPRGGGAPGRGDGSASPPPYRARDAARPSP